MVQTCKLVTGNFVTLKRLPARIVNLAHTPQPIRPKILHRGLVLGQPPIAIQVGVRPVRQDLCQARRGVEHIARRRDADRLLQAVADPIIRGGVGGRKRVTGYKATGLQLQPTQGSSR